MNVAIIGRSELLFETALLIQKHHKIKLIVTSKETQEYTKTSTDFKQLADDLGATFIYTTDINKGFLKDVVINEKIQIGISVNYNVIIKQEIIDLFRLGILNAHGGDLPRYRGNACQAWAILNGEKKIGLCIHKMVGNKVDHGDIIEKKYFHIDIKTKIIDVYRWMNKFIPQMFLESISKLEINNNYFLEKQSENPQDSLRCYPRKIEDAQINWNLSDIEIIRLINSSGLPFQGAFCYFKDFKIFIHDAELYEDGENFLAVPGQVLDIISYGVIISTGNNKKILIKLIKHEKVLMNPNKIITSIRQRLK